MDFIDIMNIIDIMDVIDIMNIIDIIDKNYILAEMLKISKRFFGDHVKLNIIT